MPSVPERYSAENEAQFRKIVDAAIRSALEVDEIRSGTTTLVNGQTTKVVDHGLRRVPNAYGVTPVEDWGSATAFWVTSVDEDQLTITVDTDPGADVDFRWWVQ
jgi:hypothetical protein